MLAVLHRLPGFSLGCRVFINIVGFLGYFHRFDGDDGVSGRQVALAPRIGQRKNGRKGRRPGNIAN
jgi:hypothetical protein